MLEKLCGRCGGPIGDDQDMYGTEDGELCLDCWLQNQCTCPEGRFRIYLPDHSVKIVDYDEYEAARRVFGNGVFIISTLDHDPRRVKRRVKNPDK